MKFTLFPRFFEVWGLFFYKKGAVSTLIFSSATDGHDCESLQSLKWRNKFV